MIIVNRDKILNSIKNIPTELKVFKAWCIFYNNSEGFLDKKPISPITKRGGITSDKADKLSEFSRVEKALKEGKASAIGVGLIPDYGVVCIDLDRHKLELKEMYEKIRGEMLDKFNSYAETSISGTGTHIFIKGKIPEGYKNKDKYGIIEVYDNRFIITSGDLIENRETNIVDCQEALEWLCETYLSKNNLKELSVVPEGISKISDNTLVEKIKEFDKGRKFINGEWEVITKKDSETGEIIQAYPSKSEADLAFCNLILYLNGNDKEQAKRIFKESDMSKGLNKKASGYLTTQMSVASLSLQKTYDWSAKADNLEQKVELDEMTLAYTNNNLVERVAEYGFNLTSSEKLNDYVAKYIQNFGVQAKNVIDTTLGDYDSGGNGKRFYYIMQNELVYNPTAKEWARWDGKKWNRCYDIDLLGATQQVFNNLKHEAFSITMQSVYEEDKEKKAKREIQAEEIFTYASTRKNKKTCMEMIEFAKDHFNPTEYLKLEEPLNAINLKNGIYDLDKMQLLPHNKYYYQTKISEAIYDQGATCPTWEKTLERIIPNSAVRLYLQKAVGYTLSSKFTEKALFILHGDGNNGKTTFINILLKIMGEYAVVVAPTTIMENAANKNNGPRPDLIKLRDKRFAAVSESNENDKLSEGIIKALTGAGYISCRTLHKEPVEFRATFKLFFDTNHKPTVRGTDTAIWSRLKVIPFEVQIPKSEIDTSLGSKLEKELSGILNWCIKGYELYMQEGLTEPEQIKLVVDQFAEDMSAMDQWWRECIEIKTDIKDIQQTSVNSKELYQSYKNWCTYNGEFSWSQRKFTSEINKKEACKLTKTVNGYIKYKAIKLNDLGILCYQRDSFISSEFSTRYSQIVNNEFKKVALAEARLKELEEKHPNKLGNIIPIKAEKVAFGEGI